MRLQKSLPIQNLQISRKKTKSDNKNSNLQTFWDKKTPAVFCCYVLHLYSIHFTPSTDFSLWGSNNSKVGWGGKRRMVLHGVGNKGGNNNAPSVCFWHGWYIYNIYTNYGWLKCLFLNRLDGIIDDTRKVRGFQRIVVHFKAHAPTSETHPWLAQCQPRHVSQAKLDNTTQTDIAPWHAQDVGSWMSWHLTFLYVTKLFLILSLLLMDKILLTSWYGCFQE